MQYPTSAKVYLSKLYGVPIQTVSRIHDVVLNEQDVRKFSPHIHCRVISHHTWLCLPFLPIFFNMLSLSLSLTPCTHTHTLTRAHTHTHTHTRQILGLQHLKSRMDEFCSEMNIPPVDPMKWITSSSAHVWSMFIHVYEHVHVHTMEVTAFVMFATFIYGKSIVYF